MSKSALVPLESNPEVMNKYLRKLGVPDQWGIVDVMGLDPELLAMVPQPVLAVLLLFPCSDAYENHKKQEEREVLAKGQQVSNNIFYLKQTLSNACGTVALVHAVLNNADKIDLVDGWMKNFLTSGKDLDPSARGALLENSDELIRAHTDMALEGQTQAPNQDQSVDHHFITFVSKDGDIYELDGRKAFPINHGPTTSDSFLEDSARICREFMARDPEEVRFTVVALAANN